MLAQSTFAHSMLALKQPVIYSAYTSTWVVVLIMQFMISSFCNSELASNNLAVPSEMHHEAIHFPRTYFHLPASIANADGDYAVPRS